MKIGSLRSNGRFDSLEKEIECPISKQQQITIYIFFLVFSFLYGFKYSDASCLPLQELNYTRDPYSPIYFTSIFTKDNETLIFIVNVNYLYDITKDNIKRGLNVFITNGPLLMNIKSSDALNFIEKDLKTNETKSYDWDLLEQKREYQQKFHNNEKLSPFIHDSWKDQFDLQESHKYVEKQNQAFYHEMQIEKKIVDVKRSKKRNVSFTFECKSLFYGSVTSWISLYNKQISNNYTFTMIKPSVNTTTIKCFNGSNGKLSCHFHNVCIKQNHIQLFLSNKDLKVNPNYMPSVKFSFSNQTFLRKNGTSSIYKLSLLTEKTDVFSSLMDCFSQFSNDMNIKTIVIDYMHLIDRLQLAPLIPLATFAGENSYCIDTLIYDEERIDPNIILNIISKTENDRNHICVYDSTKQILQDFDSFYNIILKLCPHCDVINVKNNNSVKNLYDQCKHASFIVGPLSDEMIGARFWNATVVAISPRRYRCSKWLETASRYGTKIFHLIPQCNGMCSNYYCNDCLQPNDKYHFNSTLLIKGMEYNETMNGSTTLLQIDFTNNSIIAT